MMRDLLKEVANFVVDMSSLMEGVKEWEVWEGATAITSYRPERTRKEERALWKILDELDKEKEAQMKRIRNKKQKEVSKARKQMGAGKSQPSILEQFKVAREKDRAAHQNSSSVQSNREHSSQTCMSLVIDIAKPQVEAMSVGSGGNDCFMENGWPRGKYTCDSVLINDSQKATVSQDDYKTRKILSESNAKSVNTSQEDYKTRNISNGGQKKREKNRNINTSTPTKRKLVEEKAVQNLIGFYDRANPSFQVGSGKNESPAKRRLLCRSSGGH